MIPGKNPKHFFKVLVLVFHVLPKHPCTDLSTRTSDFVDNAPLGQTLKLNSDAPCASQACHEITKIFPKERDDSK